MKKIVALVALVALFVVGVVGVPGLFAATFDQTVGGATGYSAAARPKVFVFKNTLDLSDTTGTVADVFQMIKIPADSLVLAVVPTVTTAEGAALTFDVGDGDNADGWIDGADGNAAATYSVAVLTDSVTWDPASLIDAAGETKAITVTGAALGDYVVVGAGVDVSDMNVSATVTAANTVEIRLQNESAGTLDLASSTWTARVYSGTASYSASGGKLYTTADTIDITINTAGANTAVIVLKALVVDL